MGYVLIDSEIYSVVRLGFIVILIHNYFKPDWNFFFFYFFYYIELELYIKFLFVFVFFFTND